MDRGNKSDYSSLKSGTDIGGIASDLGGKAVNLTSQAVYDISAAFVVWYVNKFCKNPNELIIALGRDSRITGKIISENVINKAIELAKGTDIDKLLSTLKTPVEEKEIRFNIKAEDFKAYGLKVIAELEKFASSNPQYRVADDN